ncbi:MAG: phenylalanine--tRNA ligase subunit beta [Candidatus Woesearchaeota archaeon]|jgi:phenylalanyl-tRNA synthetase beta chain|nr:phenylalanine--tRNA ligase subunit beta [Candidatus Woesearchaeota archaeon]
MPTITFSLTDLQNIVGKKLSVEEVGDYAHLGKGDFEGYDKETDEIKIDFGDTNLPYLWSVEGFARLIKSILGKTKGIPKIKINKSDYKIIVDNSVSKVRPFIAGFVAKGKKVDDYSIKQLIQLQEKLCENFGRRRQKVAIGVYSYKKIVFPIHYKATNPESVKFTPLDFKREMTQQEILESHPKGKEYSWILKDQKKYPILLDSKDQVLSFPPIINSAITGKVEEGEEDLLFEVTGTDLNAVLLSTNIFAYALFDRGYEIYSLEINYSDKKITTPHMFNDTIKLRKDEVKKLIGLDLKEAEIKKLLEKIHYDYDNNTVEIPPFRKDILHPVDIIEDIAISYGYNKIEEQPLTSYTIGETSQMIRSIERIREMAVGLGYIEVMSPILTNKEILHGKMNIKNSGTIELSNPVSETYSSVRSWILPSLFEVLSKNKHVEYPQKIFEQGIIASKKTSKVNEFERVAILSAHEKADFTEIKQILDCLLRSLNISYEIEDVDHDSFIPGRVGRVIVNNKKVAYIGEVSPKVLENFSLDIPVCALELNLTELFNSKKN